jgi:hypothetical protein
VLQAYASRRKIASRETLIPGIGVAFCRRAALAAVLHEAFDRNCDYNCARNWTP